jgi:hypothetical protein
MLYKTHNKLFNGKYKYKIVLVVFRPGDFRGGDLDYVLKRLDRAGNVSVPHGVENSFKRQLCGALSMMDFGIRVEGTYLSVYSNSLSDIDHIASIDPDRVKYISKPIEGVDLEPGTIVIKDSEYDYRVSLGRSKQMQDAFIDWCDANSNKVKLTPGCRRALSNNESWGGTYFYVSGDKTLLMAKMHLGTAIARIDKIIKE